MLIKLTMASPGKSEFYMRADNIVFIEKDGANLLQTNISTNLPTNKGPLVLGVLESPEQIAEAVEAAFLGWPGERKPQ